MYEEVTLHQGGEGILIAYFAVSVLLFIVFFTLKYKSKIAVHVNKVFLFVSILPFVVFQYVVFRNGMDWIYSSFNLIPDDSLFLRISALFFTVSYLFCLPVKTSKKITK